LPFKDIFIIQILCLLIARKFSGIINLVIGDNKDNVASVKFQQGMVVSVHYANFTEAQALKAIAWESKGDLVLFPQVISDNPLEHYWLIIEELVKSVSPTIINTCPTVMDIFITRVKLRPLKSSSLNLVALTVFGQIGAGYQLIEIPKENLSDEEFWKGFWFLTAHGLVINSYAKSIGTIVQQFQDDLTTKMQKLMGTHVAQTYTKRLWQNIQKKWPDWDENNEPDPIYGILPYQFKTQMIQETTQQVGTPALQQRCLESALSTLLPQNANVIHSLY
jgi:hypothetical protein